MHHSRIWPSIACADAANYSLIMLLWSVAEDNGWGPGIPDIDREDWDWGAAVPSGRAAPSNGASAGGWSRNGSEPAAASSWNEPGEASGMFSYGCVTSSHRESSLYCQGSVPGSSTGILSSVTP